MVKAPRAGRVKTRLARGIGTVAAAWWYRHQVAGLLRRLRDPRWRIVLAVSPDRVVDRTWPKGLGCVSQGRGDLGDRMRRQLRSVSEGAVVLIGSDIPGVTPAHISRAFRALGSADVVFGPAPDGGYWLVGVRRGRALATGAMRGVRWSTPYALADSCATLLGMRITLVDTLTDVDTAADLPQRQITP